MSTKRQQVVRYSISFKQQVVAELEQGVGIEELKRKYGITGGQTIQYWVRKFGKQALLSKVVRVETMEERDRIQALESEIKRLKLALADSLLAQRSLEELVNQANVLYQTDLKKSLAEQSLKDSKGSSQ